MNSITHHYRDRVCPNDGETYDRPGLQAHGKTDEHPIGVEQRVIIYGGEVALRISASCECGWSDNRII